jgi:hypothetical protein
MASDNSARSWDSRNGRAILPFTSYTHEQSTSPSSQTYR